MAKREQNLRFGPDKRPTSNSSSQLSPFACLFVLFMANGSSDHAKRINWCRNLGQTAYACCRAAKTISSQLSN